MCSLNPPKRQRRNPSEPAAPHVAPAGISLLGPARGCQSGAPGPLPDGLPPQPGSAAGPSRGRSRGAAGALEPPRALLAGPNGAEGPSRRAAPAQPLPLGQAGPFPPQMLCPRRLSPIPSVRTARPAPPNAPEPRCPGGSPTEHPPASPPLRPPGPLRPRPHVPAPSGPPLGPARAPGPPRRPSSVPRSQAGAGRSRPSSSGRRTGPAAATPPPSSLPAGPAPRARRGADGGRGGTRDIARRKHGGARGLTGRG